MIRQSPRGNLGAAVVGRTTSECRSSVSPDGRLLAVSVDRGDDDIPNRTQVWDIGTGQSVAILRNCESPLWSPDGRHLVTLAKEWEGDVWVPAHQCRWQPFGADEESWP